MAKTITDTDLVKYSHLNGDEYQLVYSIFYFYSIDRIECYDEFPDNYMFNHIVRLYTKQPEGILRGVRVKQWISILDKIIARLEGYEKSCEVVVPFCGYCCNVEVAINQFQYVKLVLFEILQTSSTHQIDLIEIEDEDEETKTFIPDLKELLNDFFEGESRLIIPCYIYNFLYKELNDFYNNQTYELDDACLSHIENVIGQELSGDDEGARDFLVELYNQYKKRNECVWENNEKSLPEYIRNRFIHWVAPFLEYITENNNNGYPDLEHIKNNELDRRCNDIDEDDLLHELYIKLYVDNVLMLPSYKAEFGDSYMQDSYFDGYYEETNVSTDEKAKEKKYGDDAKAIGLMYCLLNEYVPNRATLAKIISCILGKEWPVDNKYSKSTVYSVLSRPEQAFGNSTDYIKTEILRCNLKETQALLDLYPPEIKKFK